MALRDLFKSTPTPAPKPPVVPAKRAAAFGGAEISRLTEHLYSHLVGPNQAAQYNLGILRARARFLSRSDPYAARFLQLAETYVIGPQGVVMQPRVTDAEDDFHLPVNNELTRAWDDWCAHYASLDGQLAFTDLEQLLIRTVATDGEAFVQLVQSPSLKPHGFTLKLWDADCLDVNYNMTLSNGGAIIQGIEVDSLGRRVAYNFFSANPNDLRMSGNPIQRVRIPADDILHIYRTSAPNQYRGYSWFAPIINNLGMLHQYRYAELAAAVVGASLLHVITPPAPNPADVVDPTKATQEPEPLKIPVGAALTLLPGETLQPYNAEHPTTAFGDFTNSVLHGVASGLGVSYAALCSDTSTENYSGARLSVGLERDNWKNIQQWFIRSFHEKVYPVWLKCALATGALKLSPAKQDDYLNVQFRPRGFKWVDPAKDAQANTIALQNNLTSKQLLCAEAGVDYDDLLADRYEEQKKELELTQALITQFPELKDYILKPKAPTEKEGQKQETAKNESTAA